jgi:hypothetical protein
MNPGSSKVIFASINDSVPFTIQGFAPKIGIDTSYIPLLVATADSTQHYITLDSVLYFKDSKKFYLVDSIQGTSTLLTLKNPVPITLDTTGEYLSRFYLKVVTNIPLNIEESSQPFEGRVWAANKAIYFDNFSVSVSQVEVYNTVGQLVFSKNVNSRNSHVNLTEVNPGIYIVKLLDANGNSLTKKIYLQ